MQPATTTQLALQKENIRPWKMDFCQTISHLSSIGIAEREKTRGQLGIRYNRNRNEDKNSNLPFILRMGLMEIKAMAKHNCSGNCNLWSAIHQIHGHLHLCESNICAI